MMDKQKLGFDAEDLFGDNSQENEATSFLPPAPSISPTAAGVGKGRNLGFAPDSLSVDVLRDSGRDSHPKGVTAVRATPRGFYTTAAGLCVPTTIDGSFRVLSYNVLAQRYASSDKYPDCPPLTLTEAHRSPMIAKEIRSLCPDVIALQELSLDMYTNTALLGEQLRHDGFTGHYAPITTSSGQDYRASAEHPSSDVDAVGDSSSDCGPSSSRKDLEGVALFYRQGRFEAVHGHEGRRLRLNEGPAKDTSLTPAERKRLLIASHNVGLCLPLRCCVTRRCFIFTTVHAYWDSSRPEAQLYQLDQLLKGVESVRAPLVAQEGEANVTMVLLGDFNCETSMPPLAYLMSGTLDISRAPSITNPISTWFAAGERTPFSPKLTQTLGRRAAQKIELRHPFGFENAYREYWRQREHSSHVTAVNPSQGYVGTAIDHIFFEKGRCTALECGRLAGRKNSNGEIIPNGSTPSDHFPVVATLIPTYILKDIIASHTNHDVDVDTLQQVMSQAALDHTEEVTLPHQSASEETPSWFLMAEESLKT